MQLHRLAWTIGATSLLLLGAYACGGDDDDTNNDTPDPGSPDTGSVDRPDTSTDTPDTGSPTDAGDAGADSGLGLLCSGNPLSADGGVAATSQDGGLFTVTTGNFAYGPQYVDENGGQLLFTEFTDHVVTSIGPDGGPSTRLIDYFGDQTKNLNQSDYAGGHLYTLMANPAGGGTLLRTAFDGGAPGTIGSWGPTQLNSPNGIAIGNNGIAYVTDPGFQVDPVKDPPGTGIWSVQLADGGALTKIETGTGNPVGVALNADKTRLYVSYQGKAVKFWTIDPATGAASAPASFTAAIRFNPAGIAVDQGGNVWVAEYDGSTQRGAVEVFNSAGSRLWSTIFLPNNRATGIAFGGADRTKVFITTEKGDGESEVFSLSTRCPGTL